EARAVDDDPRGTVHRPHLAAAVAAQPGVAAQWRRDDERRTAIHGQFGTGYCTARDETERRRIRRKHVGDAVADPPRRLARGYDDIDDLDGHRDHRDTGN